MKKTVFYILVAVFIVFVAGCASKTYALTLHEPANTVVQVDIINNYTGEFEYLYSLQEDEMPGFIESLLQLNVEETYFEPSTNYGDLVVHLWYSNGHSELISSAGMCYRTETSDYNGNRYVPHADLHYLCAEYVDESMLPSHPSIEN